MELVAAVNTMKLARKMRELLRICIKETRYFTRLFSSVGNVRMLQTESDIFNEFVGGRVSEIITGV
jgi:hypothetical protein